MPLPSFNNSRDYYNDLLVKPSVTQAIGSQYSHQLSHRLDQAIFTAVKDIKRELEYSRTWPRSGQ
jgi:hypothetical protein